MRRGDRGGSTNKGGATMTFVNRRGATREAAILVFVLAFSACATQWTASDQQLLDGLKATDSARVQAALAQGANPDIAYADGMRPLGVAVARNDHASAKALLSAGANANVTVDVDPAASGQSLLSLAEDPEMATILVEGGADPNRKDGSGETPLGRAVLNGDARLVESLLGVGASVNSPLADGQSPLWFAVSTGNVTVVSALLEGGADPNHQNAGGRTVLHEAATNPNGATAAVLLKANAGVNSRAHDGTTPLMVAASDGYVAPARLLMENGADLNIRNSSGMTALDLANANGHAQVATLLEESGGEATRDAATAREEMYAQRRSAAGADALRIFTTDLTSDGRYLKIRGRVVNPFAEVVTGVRYRIALHARGTERLLDSFFEERDDTVIEPGGATVMRIDIATMYASTALNFRIEALPIRIGDREVPEPAHWH